MLKKQNFLVFFYQERLLSRKTADNQEGSPEVRIRKAVLLHKPI